MGRHCAVIAGGKPNLPKLRRGAGTVAAIVLTIMSGVGCSTPGGGQAPRYELAEIGVTVDASAFGTFCVDRAPAPARGFIASTDRVACIDLKASDSSAKVNFWVEYNVVDEFEGLDAMASSFCEGSPAQSDVALLGLKARQCCTLDSMRCLLIAQGPGEVDQRLNYFLDISATSASEQNEIARLALSAMDAVQRE